MLLCYHVRCDNTRYDNTRYDNTRYDNARYDNDNAQYDNARQYYDVIMHDGFSIGSFIYISPTEISQKWRLSVL